MIKRKFISVNDLHLIYSLSEHYISRCREVEITEEEIDKVDKAFKEFYKIQDFLKKRFRGEK